ncbi:hypothetical protein NKH45_25250 [Mesorhizobium sp. M1156]|uniref:hypothetical protein n=1 Tax=Mesorhizobium sp. M1156 TaxID=2957064 RepID=UPI00333BADDE
MNAANIANYVTIVGFPIAIVGLAFVFRQIRMDKLTASAGAVVTIHEGTRERLDLISRIERTKGGVDNSDWIGAFFDLANDLELACAIVLDSQLTGRTGKFAEFLISDMLKMIESDPSLRDRFADAIHDPETFSNIRDYIALRKLGGDA